MNRFHALSPPVSVIDEASQTVSDDECDEASGNLYTVKSQNGEDFRVALFCTHLRNNQQLVQPLLVHGPQPD